MQCQLTDMNILNLNGPRCYYATGEINNAYYHNVGLLNTGGRIVKSATLKGATGAHRGANPYYAFDVVAYGDDQVTFYYEDGGSHTVYLRDCVDGTNKQMWS